MTRIQKSQKPLNFLDFSGFFACLAKAFAIAKAKRGDAQNDTPATCSDLPLEGGVNNFSPYSDLPKGTSKQVTFLPKETRICERAFRKVRISPKKGASLPASLQAGFRLQAGG
ncbi:MAG: hypothetical protein QM537_06365 [Candidatus Symbiobacter sp.]|nr:hypothetical protein [Candidatus Symbiobacter sp.]